MGRSLFSERMKIYAYYGMMIAIYKLLPPEEREDLENWDREMVTGDGMFATSDWPGWGSTSERCQDSRQFEKEIKSRSQMNLDGQCRREITLPARRVVLGSS